MIARLDNLLGCLPALWFHDLSSLWKSLCSHSYLCSCTVFIWLKEEMWRGWSTLPRTKRGLAIKSGQNSAFFFPLYNQRAWSLTELLSSWSYLLDRPWCLILLVKCQFHKQWFSLISLTLLCSPSSFLFFFLIPSLHTPITSPAHLPRPPLPLCSPGQYSHDRFLPNGFWGHRKSEHMCRGRKKNWRQVWFVGKGKRLKKTQTVLALL